MKMTRNNLVLALLTFWLVVLLPLFIPNPGGDGGLAIPQNAIAWAVTGGIIFLIWAWPSIPTPGLQAILATSPSLKLLVTGAIILCIPLLYTDMRFQHTAEMRIAGLTVGMVYFLSVLRLNLSLPQQRLIIMLITLAVAIQAILSLVPWYFPALAVYPTQSDRLTGVFQQPNVLGSVLATGYALTWMMFILPGFRLTGMPRESLRTAVLSCLLLLFSFALFCASSRTGWLAACVVLILMTLSCHRHNRRRCVHAIACSVAGCIAGIMQLTLSAGFISHEGSNLERLAILRNTLLMIAQKPWLGWGYGSFEYEFSRFSALEPDASAIHSLSRHPHNEFLLWLLEGGAVAGLGALLICAAGIMLIRRSLQQHQSNRHSPSAALLLCICMLPVVIHTQTEYPFYLSAPHWVIFLTLLALAERSVLPAISPHDIREEIHPWQYYFAASCTALSALLVVLMSLGCLYGGMVVTRAEQTGLTDVRAVRQLPFWARWPFGERIEFDLQTHALLTYNRTHDARLLDEYVLWATHFLQQSVDINTYASLLAILRHQKKWHEAESVRREAYARFPQDQRFTPPR